MRRLTIPLAAVLVTVWLGAESTSRALDAVTSSEAPLAGNPEGQCTIPPEAAVVDTAVPNAIVGDGTLSSCTGEAFIAAVARGGVIRFNCGPEPVVITLDRPAKVVNDASPDVVIDGGGLVTLSGGGKTRILYMNTCDPEQHWTSAHCDNQDTPRLTVQNLALVQGNSSSELDYDGGGAIWARGGRLKVINSRFFNNTCAGVGPDVGGARSEPSINTKGCPCTSSTARLVGRRGTATLARTVAGSAASACPGPSSTASSLTTGRSVMAAIPRRKAAPAAAAVAPSITMARA